MSNPRREARRQLRRETPLAVDPAKEAARRARRAATQRAQQRVREYLRATKQDPKDRVRRQYDESGTARRPTVLHDEEGAFIYTGQHWFAAAMQLPEDAPMQQIHDLADELASQ